MTVENFKLDTVYPGVVRATREILIYEDELAPVNLFIRMGLLDQEKLICWRRGNVPYLEKVIRCNLSKANRILRILGMHAHDLNLGRKTVQYMTEGRRKSKELLRFSKTGDPGIERAYATHYTIIGDPEKFRARLLTLN